LSMRNLKRVRCTAVPALTRLESQFARNGWPLQCCHYLQRTDEASLQQRATMRGQRRLMATIHVRKIIAVTTTKAAHEPNCARASRSKLETPKTWT
jgi:hypothetical protein